MDKKTCYLLIISLTNVLPAVYKKPSQCGKGEFKCGDDSCITFNQVCDGLAHCVDGSDERHCQEPMFGYESTVDLLVDKGSRNKRQVRNSKCRSYQFRCRDGTCISFDGKCDGIVNCPDRSDESFALCKQSQCQMHLYRCAYGACVDGAAPCNGVQECADNSDEIQPSCRNGTEATGRNYKCQDGSSILSANKCDGVTDCPDGSDETIQACWMPCPSNLFQCAYGACVDQDSDCDGKIDCADGSDESNELCNRNGGSEKPVDTGSTSTVKPTQPSSETCVLPPYPAQGTYTVEGIPNPKPGDRYETVSLNVTCKPGYGINGDPNVVCFKGFWVSKMPECGRLCRLPPHVSVEYQCEVPNTNGGYRACTEYEPNGTKVRPRCRAPNYYSSWALPTMNCNDGSWDHIAICQPECGRITPTGEQLVIGGRSAQRGELPWHVGIYRKTTTPYEQICGGTIISTSLVISAAHCFWSDITHQQPPNKYAVAAGKLYRPWNNPMDKDAQKYDVSDIKIPPRFLGAETNYQEDIALVFVSQSFVYQTFIRPICLDFEPGFDQRQLSQGSLAKVAGWGLTGENGAASQVLKVVEMPYVDISRCLLEAPRGFREYITSDKICAGFHNGTALCKGDSGGGLVFPSLERGAERFYLRGIVSTAPTNENKCNAYAITTFTHIQTHESFIRQHYTAE